MAGDLGPLLAQHSCIYTAIAPRGEPARCVPIWFPSVYNNGRGVETSLICLWSWNWALFRIIYARPRSCARALAGVRPSASS